MDLVRNRNNIDEGMAQMGGDSTRTKLDPSKRSTLKSYCENLNRNILTKK